MYLDHEYFRLISSKYIRLQIALLWRQTEIQSHEGSGSLTALRELASSLSSEFDDADDTDGDNNDYTRAQNDDENQTVK